MKIFPKDFGNSFIYALQGLFHVFSTQPNSRFHLFSAICVLILSVLLKLNFFNAAILIIMIGFVWSMECLNTAIENVVDLVTQDIHPMAKNSKDAAAASVLIASLSAVGVGAIILGPPLLKLLCNWIG